MRKIKIYLRTLIATYSDATGKRLSYRALSHETGVATNTISHLANNKQELLDRSVLERLCDFFDCELSDLIRLESDDEPESGS